MNDRRAAALLESLVRIPSPSGHEQEMAAFLVDAMRDAGLQAQVDPAGNAIGTWGKGPPHVILLGHMDTVPGEIPVRHEGGCLHGRGTVDAKGPLAAFVAATARLRAAETVSPKITVIGCVEEEAPSSRGARYVVNRYHPDACIVGEPSGWEGITLGYKGFLKADLLLEQECTHSAHGLPTAADRASRLWTRIREQIAAWNQGRERLFDQLLCTLVHIQSGSDGNREHARLEIKLRLPRDLGPEAAVDWLRANASECRLEVSGGIPAWSGPRTSWLHRTLFRSIRTHGGEPRFLLKTGTADLNIVAPAWNCPALAYGPGDASLDHTPHEHILLDEYQKGIAVLEQTLTQLQDREKRVEGLSSA